MEKKSICLVIILKGHLLTFDICKRAINKLICVELKKRKLHIIIDIYIVIQTNYQFYKKLSSNLILYLNKMA